MQCQHVSTVVMSCHVLSLFNFVQFRSISINFVQFRSILFNTNGSDELWRAMTSLQNPFESNWSPGKSPLMDKLDKFWVCESHRITVLAATKREFRPEAASQTQLPITNGEMMGDVLCDFKRSFTRPKYTRHNFYVLNCQQNYCFSSFSSQTAVSLVVLWACRFTPPSFIIHNISQKPLADPAAMSLALPKLMGTAFWFTSLAWANLSNEKHGHQSSPVLYVLSARRFVVFWKVAQSNLFYSKYNWGDCF